MTENTLIQNYYNILLPTGIEGRGVFGVGSIPVAIHPSCQDKKTFAFIQLHKHKYSWVVYIRHTSEAVLRSHYFPGPSYCTLTMALWVLVSIMSMWSIVA